MSNYRKASEDIQAFAARVQGVVELGELLGRVADIDTLEAEIGKREQAARAAEQAALKDLASVNADIATAKAGLGDVKKKVQKVVDDAKAKADKTLADAHVEGDQIVNDAKASANAITVHAATVKQELTDIQAKIATSTAEHASLTAQINALKDKMAEFVRA